MSLLQKTCRPCEGGIDPLSGEDLHDLMVQVSEHWALSEDKKKISRVFKFKNFVQAFDFLKQVADLAESEGHHPDIFNSWNRVELTLWTHAIGGLSENDFILAAKIDALKDQA